MSLDEELLRMAKEAGLTDPDLDDWVIDYGYAETRIKKFAQLLENAVREKCAQIAADLYAQARADEIESAIRAMRDEPRPDTEVYTPPPQTPEQQRINGMKREMLAMIKP